MKVTLDLFGDPIPANHGRRGRPQHTPTAENRNKINMCLALGWSNERIAAALRITLPTLRKYYFSELKFRDVARDRLSAALAMRIWGQVEAGNVTAMREFQRFVDRNDGLGKPKLDDDEADTDDETIAPREVASWDDVPRTSH